MLITLFAFQIVLTPKRTQHTESTVFVLYLQKFPRTAVIYRHEEIERLRSGNPWKDADWATGNVRKIADGSLDRKKQSAFYVDITTGEIGLHPGLITREEASEEIERAERLSEDPAIFSDEYRRLKDVLPRIFSNLKEE